MCCYASFCGNKGYIQLMPHVYSNYMNLKIVFKWDKNLNDVSTAFAFSLLYHLSMGFASITQFYRNESHHKEQTEQQKNDILTYD